MTEVRVAFHMARDMRMAREIMEEAVAAGGCAVVGESLDDAAGDLVATAVASNADVLIVGADGCDGDEIRRLLEVRPEARVLALEPDGNGGSLYELRPHRIRLADLSPGALVQALVTAAPPGFERASA